jgi:uncharacterized protein (UPF0264 family)
MRKHLMRREERGRVGLLVSVRSAAEARNALAGGADVIDVKEPSRGPLGAADATTIEEVIVAVNGQTPITAAAGELADHIARPSWSGNFEIPCGLALFKIGLAECAEKTDWRGPFQRFIDQHAGGPLPCAVAYADWRAAGSIAPNAVLQAGIASGCRALLVDTWDKSAGTVFDLWKARELAAMIAEARGHGLTVALAGSLSLRSIPEAAALGPDFVAVRAAACEGKRTGVVSARRVAALREALEPKVTSRMVEFSTRVSPGRRLESVRSTTSGARECEP